MFGERRGQITIFIILGLIILGAFLLINWVGDKGKENNPDDFIGSSLSANIDRYSLDNYYTECIKGIAYDALLENPPEKIGLLIEQRIEECSDVESLYPGVEFSYGIPKVITKKNNFGNILFIEVGYPITLSDKGSKTKISSFSVEIPLIEKAKLSFDENNKTKEDMIIEILDGKINLLVPKGVSPIGTDGENIKEIIYAVREADNGNIILDLKPDHTVFSRALVLRISLDGVDIPVGFDTSRVGIGVFDEGIKRFVPVSGSYFDPLTNELVAPIKHFSMFTWGIIRNDSNCGNNSNLAGYVEFMENISRRIIDDYINGSIDEKKLNATVDHILRNSKKYNMGVAWFVNVNGSFGIANLSDFNFSVDISNISIPDEEMNFTLLATLKKFAYDDVMNHTNGSVDNQSINTTLEKIFNDAINLQKSNITLNNTVFNQLNITNFSFSVNFTDVVSGANRTNGSANQCKQELGFSDVFEFPNGEFSVCNPYCPKSGATTTTTVNIDVKDAGRHMVFGLVDKGQNGVCQMDEVFHLAANGGRTPTTKDGSCDNTIEWEPIGQLDFVEGNNEISMVHDGSGTSEPESVALLKLSLGAMPENDSKYYWIDNFGKEYTIEYLDNIEAYSTSTTTRPPGSSGSYSFKEISRINDFLWFLVCVDNHVYSAAYNAKGNNNVYTLDGALYHTVDNGAESSRVYNMNGTLYMTSEQKSGGPNVWKGKTKVSSDFGSGYILAGAYYDGKSIIASNIAGSHSDLYDCSGNSCKHYMKIDDMRTYEIVPYDSSLYLLGKRATGGYTGGVATIYNLNTKKFQDFTNGHIAARGEVYDGKLFVGLTTYGGNGDAVIKSFDGKVWKDEISFPGYGHFGDFEVHNGVLYATVVKEKGNPEVFIKNKNDIWKKILNANTLKNYGTDSALNGGSGFLSSCNGKLYMNINTPTNYRKGPGYIIEIIGSEKGTNETFNATKTGVLKADLETAEKGVTPSPDNIEAVGKRMTAMGYNSSLFINPNVGYPKDTILVDGKVYDILCVEKCTPYKWDPPAERTDLHP